MKKTILFLLTLIIVGIILSGYLKSRVLNTAIAISPTTALTITHQPVGTLVPPTTIAKPSSTSIPTAIGTLNPAENMLLALSTILSPLADESLPSAILYYFDSYSDREEGDKHGIFLLPDKRAILLPNGKSPISWSPSGSQLLLRDMLNNDLYLAGPYGENPQLLYQQTDTGVFWGPIWWLGEDALVFNIMIGMGDMKDTPPLPDDVQVGLLDVTNRTYHLININEPHWVVAVSPQGQFWIECSPISKKVELVFIDGTREFLWDGSIDLPNNTNGQIKFSSLGNGLFLFGNNESGLYFMEIVGGKPQSLRLLVTAEDLMHKPYRSLSPNELFVGMIDNQMQFSLFNLEFNDIVLQMPWVESLNSPPSMVWSPSSRWIATDFATKYNSGIMLYDVFNGETTEILTDTTGIFHVLDWRILPLEPSLP